MKSSTGSPSGGVYTPENTRIAKRNIIYYV